MFARFLSRTAAAFGLFTSLLLSGCMNPGMYYGAPYGRPMYAPPQMLNQTMPGSLVIPESGDTYEPGRTYNQDPDRADDFERSDDDRFFRNNVDDNDDVPQPQPRSNTGTFDEDLDGSTRLEPFRGTHSHNSDIQQASHIEAPMEHGFDTAHYQWLRGSVSYSKEAGGWVVTYSIAADDRYQGQLSLNLTSNQTARMRNGDFVDVQGNVHPTLKDYHGQPVYQVSSIRKLTAANVQ